MLGSRIAVSTKATGDADDGQTCPGEPEGGPDSVAPEPEACAPPLKSEPNGQVQSRQPQRTAAALQDSLPDRPDLPIRREPVPPSDMRPVVSSTSLAPAGGRQDWGARALGMRPVTGRMASEPLPGSKQHSDPSIVAIKEAMRQLPPHISPLESVLSWIESTATDHTLSGHGDVSFDNEEGCSDHSKSMDIGRDDTREPDSPRCEVADESTIDWLSDHEAAPPREPPRAPTNGPNMKDGQASGATTTALAQRSLVLKKTNLISLKSSSASNNSSLVFKEEEEWVSRQSISGVIGRMVTYIEGDAPIGDILGLRCSRRGRIMVTAVREDGRAARAGVAAGDELKSIDGWKGFQSCPASLVHANLVSPVTLIFVGFVGKLQAEVRVKRLSEPSCGLPAASDIVTAFGTSKGKPQTLVKLCDEVVFQPGLSSLFIVTQREEPENKASDQQAMYELHSTDARSVVNRAMNSGPAPSFSRSSPPAWPLAPLPEGHCNEGMGATLPFRSSPPQQRAPSQSGIVCPGMPCTPLHRGSGAVKNVDNPCLPSVHGPSSIDYTHSL